MVAAAALDSTRSETADISGMSVSETASDAIREIDTVTAWS